MWAKAVAKKWAYPAMPVLSDVEKCCGHCHEAGGGDAAMKHCSRWEARKQSPREGIEVGNVQGDMSGWREQQG